MLSAQLASALHGLPPDFFRAATASYGRWLITQENSRLTASSNAKVSWLLQQKRLFSRRAPGTTCLSSLHASRGKVTRAANDSKGCGGVMRIAPVGMYFAHALNHERQNGPLIPSIFATGSDLAAITHGHPSGCLSAGVLAVIIGLVLSGSPLKDAIAAAKDELRKQKSHKETLAAIERAEALAQDRPRERAALRLMGKGFVAEEALAIGLYCALCAQDFEDGIILAVNHSGDSDSTGMITGSLLGAAVGVKAIPDRWLAVLELRSTIEALADDLAAFPEWHLNGQADAEERTFYSNRYPVS
jgi:ADP-ribosylglycohydrolase